MSKLNWTWANVRLPAEPDYYLLLTYKYGTPDARLQYGHATRYTVAWINKGADYFLGYHDLDGCVIAWAPITGPLGRIPARHD